MTTEFVKAAPKDLAMQIEILYCNFGETIKSIAEKLEVPEGQVSQHIKVAGLAQRENMAILDPKTAQVLQEQALDTADLKKAEIAKQKYLAPQFAITEIALLNRIAEAAVTTKDPCGILTLVSAYKKLTQDAIINSVVNDEKGKTGAPAVAVQILQFND